MFRLLLTKDLRRAWHNPLPWLINLAVPLAVVALVGLTFGSSGKKDAGFGRMRFAVVDEDGSRLGQFLRGAMQQGEGNKYLDPVFLDREPAMARLMENEFSAIVVLPKNFTTDYLGGRPTRLELIKNPAQSIYPSVMEELVGVLVAGLSAVSRNFSGELVAWREVIDGKGGYRRVSELIAQEGQKLEALRDFVNPPLVSYTKVQRANEAKATEAGARFNLFGYLLLGMGGMFLLFLAGIGVSDLHRELQLRTLDRFRTLHDSLFTFVATKVAFSGTMLLLCAAILFGGGALVFGIRWPKPLPLVPLVAAYVIFATGLMALLVSIIPDQRKSETLRSLVSMGLGIAGGCAFPPDQFPAFLREQVMPFLPTHWFVAAARTLEFNAGQMAWPMAATKLALAGVACLAVAAWSFRRLLARGARV